MDNIMHNIETPNASANRARKVFKAIKEFKQWGGQGLINILEWAVMGYDATHDEPWDRDYYSFVVQHSRGEIIRYTRKYLRADWYASDPLTLRCRKRLRPAASRRYRPQSVGDSAIIGAFTMPDDE